MPDQWVPRDDDAYDWSVMRSVEMRNGGVGSVGTDEERPRPEGDYVSCGRCGARGWDADWGGPHRCTRCQGVGWLPRGTDA